MTDRLQARHAGLALLLAGASWPRVRRRPAPPRPRRARATLLARSHIGRGELRHAVMEEGEAETDVDDAAKREAAAGRPPPHLVHDGRAVDESPATVAPVALAHSGRLGYRERSGKDPCVAEFQVELHEHQIAHGLGNTSLAVKVKLLDPREHTIGPAVAPMLELLSDASLADSTLGLSRVNWELPVSVQVGKGSTRAFATTGYFSPGALFLAAALEHALSPKFTLTGAISQMYATSTTDGTDLQGLSRSRTDLTESVARRVAPALWVAGSLGRTVSILDQNGVTLLASASISYSIAARKRPQP